MGESASRRVWARDVAVEGREMESFSWMPFSGSWFVCSLACRISMVATSPISSYFLFRRQLDVGDSSFSYSTKPWAQVFIW